MCVLFFFFFKQKTAYEMRISDWSSDVCSSDLGRDPGQIGLLHRLAAEQADRTGAEALHGESEVGERRMIAERHAGKAQGADVDLLVQPAISGGNGGAEPARSEEHTSELQSLMRISYAVFCLKKKKTQMQKTQQTH